MPTRGDALLHKINSAALPCLLMQLLSAARPAISRRGLSRVQQLTVSATMQPTRVLSKVICSSLRQQGCCSTCAGDTCGRRLAHVCLLQEVATDPGARPALARSGACAAVVDSGRSLLMFGGYVEAAEEGAPPSRDPTNEVWVFHAEGLAWRRLEPTAAADGALPQPRIVSQAVAVGQQVRRRRRRCCLQARSRCCASLNNHSPLCRCGGMYVQHLSTMVSVLMLFHLSLGITPGLGPRRVGSL